MNSLKLTIGLLIFSIALTACGQLPSSTTVTIKDRIFIVDIVDDQASRQQGLSGRDFLAANQGMLFIFPDQQKRSFWMKDMNFSIDIVWLQGDVVIGWETDLPVPLPQLTVEPPIYESPEPVNQVLELPAGTLKDLDIQLGDMINIDL
jgi:uncharacterized protein